MQLSGNRNDGTDVIFKRNDIHVTVGLLVNEKLLRCMKRKLYKHIVFVVGQKIISQQHVTQQHLATEGVFAQMLLKIEVSIKQGRKGVNGHHYSFIREALYALFKRMKVYISYKQKLNG